MKSSRNRWLTLISLLLAGCQQTPAVGTEKVSTPNEETPQQKQLAESLETWNVLKAENGNHYRYEVSAGSVFGPSYDTTLTVQAGEVVQRDLAITEIDDEGNVSIVESWSETGAALGSHDEGAGLIPVDSYYSHCRNDVLNQDSETNYIYLELLGSGVLSYCFYVPKDVAYDGGGYVITGLEFPPLTTTEQSKQKGDGLSASPRVLLP